MDDKKFYLALFPSQYSAVKEAGIQFPKARNTAKLFLRIIQGLEVPFAATELGPSRSEMLVIPFEHHEYESLLHGAKENSCTVSSYVRWRVFGEPLRKFSNPCQEKTTGLNLIVESEQFDAFMTLRKDNPAFSSLDLLLSFINGERPPLQCEDVNVGTKKRLSFKMSRKQLNELHVLADGGSLASYLRHKVFASARPAVKPLASARPAVKPLAKSHAFAKGFSRRSNPGSERDYLEFSIHGYENDAIVEAIKMNSNRFKTKGDLLLGILAGEELELVQPVPNGSYKRMITRVYLDVVDIDAIKSQMVKAGQNPVSFIRAVYFGADYQPMRATRKQREA
jgi:hypothetical protein